MWKYLQDGDVWGAPLPVADADHAAENHLLFPPLQDGFDEKRQTWWNSSLEVGHLCRLSIAPNLKDTPRRSHRSLIAMQKRPPLVLIWHVDDVQLLTLIAIVTSVLLIWSTQKTMAIYSIGSPLYTILVTVMQRRRLCYMVRMQQMKME